MSTSRTALRIIRIYKYGPNKERVITGIKRIKPGLRGM